MSIAERMVEIKRYVEFFFQKQDDRRRKTCDGLISLPLAFASGFCFLLALYAGLFVMLALANLLKNATASTLTLKTLQRAFQGLVLTNANLGHCYPSPRSSRLDISRPDGRTAKPWCYYIAFRLYRQCLFYFFYQNLPSPGLTPPRSIVSGWIAYSLADSIVSFPSRTSRCSSASMDSMPGPPLKMALSS